jgi:hypothetical protein
MDFGERTNALACAHCGSRLLVTGHGRVLSYFAAPKLDGERAAQIARSAQQGGPVRTGDARLFFLPYYRLTGTDLRWQRPERKPPPPPDFTEANAGNESLVISLIVREAEHDVGDEIECRDRATERNFLALEAPGTGLYSLGVRPSALRLELYRRGVLDALGQVVAVEMTCDAAFDVGLKVADRFEVACRAVIGEVLSIVYFPFWLVEIRRPQKRALAIVDAVSQSVVTPQAPIDLVERFGRAADDDVNVIGLRPLVCPNCGWDLPVEPDHVIFYCGSCQKAWRISGDDLLDVDHAFVAAPQAAEGKPIADYLPFWALRAAITDEAPRPYLVPAFRYRQARALVELTTRLSALALTPATAQPPPRARGASFDASDASALALLSAAGREPRDFSSAERYRGKAVTIEESRLVWLPYLSDVYSLRDPFCGAPVTAKLLG